MLLLCHVLMTLTVSTPLTYALPHHSQHRTIIPASFTQDTSHCLHQTTFVIRNRAGLASSVLIFIRLLYLCTTYRIRCLLAICMSTKNMSLCIYTVAGCIPFVSTYRPVVLLSPAVIDRTHFASSLRVVNTGEHRHRVRSMSEPPSTAQRVPVLDSHKEKMTIRLADIKTIGQLYKNAVLRAVEKPRYKADASHLNRISLL